MRASTAAALGMEVRRRLNRVMLARSRCGDLTKLRLGTMEKRGGGPRGERVARARDSSRGRCMFYTRRRTTGDKVLNHRPFPGPVPAWPTDTNHRRGCARSRIKRGPRQRTKRVGYETYGSGREIIEPRVNLPGVTSPSICPSRGIRSIFDIISHRRVTKRSFLDRYSHVQLFFRLRRRGSRRNSRGNEDTLATHSH